VDCRSRLVTLVFHANGGAQSNSGFRKGRVGSIFVADQHLCRGGGELVWADYTGRIADLPLTLHCEYCLSSQWASNRLKPALEYRVGRDDLEWRVLG
jgi:hypothetical protein